MKNKIYKWDRICISIEAGFPIDQDYLRGALENSPDPPPQTVRNYLADIIHKKGLPKRAGCQMSMEERAFTGLRNAAIYLCYRSYQEYYRGEGRQIEGNPKGTPSELAIERIAAENKLSEAAVRKVIQSKPDWSPELIAAFLKPPMK